MASSLWLEAAYKKHKDLALPVETLLQSHDLVQGAIGRDWFDAITSKLDGKRLTIGDVHPLYREMTSYSETALLEICDLAKYLQAFTNDKALPAILDDLRSDKYQSTLFELAMAFRFMRGGAEVRLQPPTPRGRVADFAAVISGLEFTVEASVARDESFNTPAFRGPRIAAETVRAASVGFAVAVRLEIRAFPEGNWEAALRAEVLSSCNALKNQQDQSKNVRVEHEHWTIEVEKVSDKTEPVPDRDEPLFVTKERAQLGDWDSCFRLLLKRPRGAASIESFLEDPREAELARVFVKLPDGSKADPYSVITKKTEKETRQLRGIEGPRLVILDISSVQSDVFDLSQEDVLSGLRKSMINTPELAAVWLASRRISTRKRLQYHVYFVENSFSVYQVPVSFMESIGHFMWSFDFLTESKIQFTEEEIEVGRRHYRDMKGRSA